MEPNVRWRLPFLQMRAATYQKAKDPLALQAEADVKQFEAWQGKR